MTAGGEPTRAPSGPTEGADDAASEVLTVEDLRVRFTVPDLAAGGAAPTVVSAVDGVSFRVAPAQCVALVGASGSGKSAIARAIMRLLPERTAEVSGRITLGGRDLTALSTREMRRVRGGRIGFVFQDPGAAFNPVYTIGFQLSEALALHRIGRWRDRRQNALALLARVGFSDPKRLYRAYPHELSGGMQQRAMIAIALAGNPDVLIADEPTSALDTLAAARINALIAGLQRDRKMSVLLISHDLEQVARVADRIVVLYAGRVTEEGEAARVLEAPQHAYTRALLASVPPLRRKRRRRRPTPTRLPVLPAPDDGASMEAEDEPRADDEEEEEEEEAAPLLLQNPRSGPALARGDFDEHGPRETEEEDDDDEDNRRPIATTPPPPTPTPPTPSSGPTPKKRHALVYVQKLTKLYPRPRGWFRRPELVPALEGVSFYVRRRETFGLVGASGSGKSTLGRCLTRLTEPTVGRVVFDGKDVTSLPAAELRALRRRVQIVFQDAAQALDPNHTVGASVREGLDIFDLVSGRDEADDEVAALFARVGLGEALRHRYPHELSGGERQRVCIARALAVRPDFIVLDEPTSALDLPVQAQILNLLQDLQEDLGLSLLFISHDLRVVQWVSHRIGVMHRGRLVEMGPTDAVVRRPQHPYTRALFRAMVSSGKDVGDDDDHYDDDDGDGGPDP
ncbi:MAG: ABC transporter ATP-binding protein [Myxococcota bacterium]